jgi:hypothetical protein
MEGGDGLLERVAGQDTGGYGGESKRVALRRTRRRDGQQGRERMDEVEQNGPFLLLLCKGGLLEYEEALVRNSALWLSSLPPP